MAIMLALSAAAFYGSADFVGGLATRRSSAVLVVAFGAQLAGLLVLVGAMPFLGGASVTTTDLAYGAAAGVFGASGLVVVFRSLAAGPMSVVAPATALSAAMLPILFGLALGERPGLAALGGIGIALLAVVLITRERDDRDPLGRTALQLRVVLPALGGGALFAGFFVMLHQSNGDSGMWPLLAARLVSVLLLAALVATRGERRDFNASMAPALLVSGALDMVANICFLLASRYGMLAVVSALTGLYPAGTVILAQTRLDERLQRSQMAGLGVAACAAVLIAA